MRGRHQAALPCRPTIRTMTQKPPPPAFKITRCPTCGSPAIHWVLERWAFDASGDTKPPPSIPHWKCDRCGERLFDRVSQSVLNAWRASAKKKKVARKPAVKRVRTRTRAKV